MSNRIYIDLETTGLSPANGDRIIEVGAVKYSRSWDMVGSLHSLVHPGKDAMDRLFYSEQVDINQIETANLRYAPTEDQVSFMLREFLDESKDGYRLFSFNRSFERKFLCLEPWSIGDEEWGECIMIASQKMMSRKTWPNLQVAAAFCDIEPTENHRAYSDAKMAGKIHQHILEWRGE